MPASIKQHPTPSSDSAGTVTAKPVTALLEKQRTDDREAEQHFIRASQLVLETEALLTKVADIPQDTKTQFFSLCDNYGLELEPNQQQELRTLLQKHPALKLATQKDQSGLVLAAQMGNVKAVTTLVEQGAFIIGPQISSDKPLFNHVQQNMLKSGHIAQYSPLYQALSQIINHLKPYESNPDTKEQHHALLVANNSHHALPSSVHYSRHWAKVVRKRSSLLPPESGNSNVPALQSMNIQQGAHPSNADTSKSSEHSNSDAPAPQSMDIQQGTHQSRAVASRSLGHGNPDAPAPQSMNIQQGTHQSRAIASKSPGKSSFCCL